MKHRVRDEYREFFQLNNSIEFEDLLTNQEVNLLNEDIIYAFTKNKAQGKEKILNFAPQKLFEEGHNLWKKSEIFKKNNLHRVLAETAFQLQGQHPLRIGYDQYFPAIRSSSLIMDSYKEFLKNPTTLQEMSSIQGIVCGALVALKDQEIPPVEGETILFPRKIGNVVFIHPNGLINWSDLLDGKKSEYFLVVYANSKSIYVRNPKDPFTGSYIQEGYSTGDRLTDKKNPIVFR